MEKHFDGYFGLDGITFGILDWTADNLPWLFHAYQARNKDRFDSLFGSLHLPMKGGCVDSEWVCNQNKKGNLSCDPKFHEAFAESLRNSDFQKAQLDVALAQYEERLARYSSLGLKTEYGNTAMAVVANNLANGEQCRPESWKKACANQLDETSLVQCMLEKYASSNCRGSSRGSRERVTAINTVFAGTKPSTNIHPTAAAVVACSVRWGMAN